MGKRAENAEKNRRIFRKCCKIFNIAAVILVLGLFVAALIFAFTVKDTFKAGHTNSEVPEAIIIPTVDEIRANGYPTNENGETYGPEVWESTDPSPDLILVIADDGQDGYVKKTDMDSGVTTPEEAANYKPSNRVLNVYLHDGITVIGTFTLNGD